MIQEEKDRKSVLASAGMDIDRRRGGKREYRVIRVV